MAEEKPDAAPEGDAKEEQTKKSNKSLFILIGIIVLALAGGAGAYFMFAGKKSDAPDAKKAEKDKKELKTALIALDAFVVNLAEHGRFLKVTMQLEIADATLQPVVVEKMPQLRDAIITLVSSKSSESVSSPEGKMQLKDEILLRSNQAVGKEVFKNLYFTEFVMQ